MASLYAVHYSGQTEAGGGAMYVGNGVVAGFDIYGGRYKGTYTENGERITAAVTLSMPGGGVLATGEQLPAGASIQILADWPADLGNSTQQLQIGERSSQITFNKMADIP